MAKDLRTFLREVLEERAGDIKIVDRPVDPHWGITAWGAEYAKRGEHPAFLFPNVQGAELPCITNLAATFDRMALALGVGVEELTGSSSIGSGRAGYDPIEVSTSEAPVKHTIWRDDEADLTRLPIPVHNHADGGPFLTAAVGIMRDPDSGELNAGIYRHHVFGPKRLGVWFFGSHHGGVIHRRCEEAGREAPIALAIGHHPAFLMGAVSRVPGIGGEYAAAGAFLEESVEIVRAETSDLMVPARAEVVIEGVVLPNERAEEGPFAEWPGHYVAGGPKPVIRVDCITMRENALFHDIQAAGREHRLMGALPRMTSVHQSVSRVIPSLKAVNIPLHTRMHCYISIDKASDADPTRAAIAALNTEPENFRMIVVVDSDINVYDESEVSWAIGTRFDAERDLQVIPRWNGPGGLLPTNWSYDADGARAARMSSAVIVDATKPAPPVKFPERAHVPVEARATVDPSAARDLTPESDEAKRLFD
jgi:2,5-furandicarboxylate decarboxylase 1